jgi:hypothetical protein
MQPWQIKALELEESALEHLDGFVHEHPLYFLIGVIYLLLALLVWILRGGLWRRFKQRPGSVQPVIIIESRTPPAPPQEAFDPFPPLRDPPGRDEDDD